MTDYTKLAADARARANAATKGPWHIHEGDLVNAEHDDAFTDWEEEDDEGNSIGPDTVFILAAREDVPALADAIDDLQKERDRLRAALEYYADEKRWPAVSPSPLIAKTALAKS